MYFSPRPCPEPSVCLARPGRPGIASPDSRRPRPLWPAADGVSRRADGLRPGQAPSRHGFLPHGALRASRSRSGRPRPGEYAPLRPSAGRLRLTAGCSRLTPAFGLSLSLTVDARGGSQAAYLALLCHDVHHDLHASSVQNPRPFSAGTSEARAREKTLFADLRDYVGS